ncbi:hypothetical protein KFK09_013404 [Dendrobium nobile]|uniref:Uncharacterized protein n=1 Tax=Dendrobium nobile TaxID=94219 RepID=A0A8T3B9I6_DENNO|nr:hypothetical protein KFK09_013404 [Dendrobium nobile]
MSELPNQKEGKVGAGLRQRGRTGLGDVGYRQRKKGDRVRLAEPFFFASGAE